MADQVFQSPTDPHFFQPLLPGFESFLNIPVKFFSVYIEEINEGETVELRSDASEKTWKVKMEDRRLTVGWRDFASAHDFRVGDIIVFRHEGALAFHVTALGPSCCEFQYVQSCNEDDHLDNDQENIRNMPMEQSLETELESSLDEDNKDNTGKLTKQVKKRIPEAEAKTGLTKRNKSGDSCQDVPSSSSSVSENRFLTLTVTPYSIRQSRLYLPKKFTRDNKMEKARGEKITLMDKHGVEWPVTLLMDKTYKRMSLRSGLKEFFNAIDLRAYESVVLEFVWEETSTLPIFKFRSKTKT